MDRTAARDEAAELAARTRGCKRRDAAALSADPGDPRAAEIGALSGVDKDREVWACIGDLLARPSSSPRVVSGCVLRNLWLTCRGYPDAE